MSRDTESGPVVRGGIVRDAGGTADESNIRAVRSRLDGVSRSPTRSQTSRGYYTARSDPYTSSTEGVTRK